MRGEAQRNYVQLQAHVFTSTMILRSMRVHVPWKYAETMLQAPDYTVEYEEIRAFLNLSGDDEFARAVEEAIRQGPHEEGLAREPDLKPSKVMFYDEASHYKQPYSACMGFSGIWYLVAENEEIMYADSIRPGTLLRKAGLRYRTRQDE